MSIERSCSVTAVAFSQQRISGVRLMSGPRRTFGLNAGHTVVNVPYPALEAGWTRTTLTCGVALQCSPSKNRLYWFRLHELTARQLAALAVVEGGVVTWLGDLQLPRTHMNSTASHRESSTRPRPRRRGDRRPCAGAGEDHSGPVPAHDSGPDHRPATRIRFAGRQVQTRLRPDAVDVLAHRCQRPASIPLAATVACATRICRHRRNPRTTTWRSTRSAGQ